MEIYRQLAIIQLQRNHATISPEQGYAAFERSVAVHRGFADLSRSEPTNRNRSELSKTQPTPLKKAPQPPSPDDAPIPDQGAIPIPYNSSSPIKRALRRLDPNCLDGIFHLCWSSPPTDDPIYKSYEKKRVAEDLDLGDVFMKKRNYRGAEFRFEDALEYEPDNPEATFKLAEALKSLDRKAEACIEYKNYLDVEPSGAFSERAKKSLQMLTPCPVLPVQ